MITIHIEISKKRYMENPKYTTPSPPPPHLGMGVGWGWGGWGSDYEAVISCNLIRVGLL